MIYYTTIDTIVDVVSYISTALPDRVKLFIDDAHETVSVLLAGPYCVRINNQADTRNPCENTIVMRRFGQVLDSTVLPDGAVVSLVASGPVKTIRDIFSPNVELLHPAHSMDDSYTGTSRSEVDIEQIVKQILDEPQRRKYDMDDAVTAESENIYTQKDVYHYNWARSFDLFSEERNVIAYVTKELRLRQQHHRQFLLSILKACRGAPLLPSTMATLLSAQEAMLCLVSLRELQNIGSLSDVDAISKFTATYLLNDEKESRLLRSAAQLEAAQLIIRRSIVSIAKNIKEAREDDTFISNATAVEIFYSTPDHVVLLLLEIVKWYKEFLVSVVDLREKVLMTEALCGVVLIIIGTIQKSRSDLRSLADTSFWKGCWTNTGDDRSLGTLLNRLCILLCDGLQDFLTLPAMLSQRPVPATEQSHQHMLEHIVFIMDFILRNHSLLYQENQQSAFFSSFIRETLFRKVYIENADIGYPFGSPRANASSPLNKAIIGYCEEFSYAYLAKELISCFCLAEPVERPLDEVHQYEKLQYYCRKDPRVVELTFAYLLDAGRHFELVNLPSLLPSCEGVNDQLLRFLRSNAPHLEWLAQHDSFESILCQGRMAQPNLPYGTTALESKGRTLSVAWLSYASIPSCEPSRISSLLLETECVEAQNTFLRGCHCISDYREMIQSLLSLDSVDAWVKAARIGVLVEGSIGDDLCSQVLRRCTQQDGDVALQIRQDAMSEKEMATRLSATALGKVICACPRLRDHNNLHRLTLSFLSTEILKVMCDFVDYYFLTDNKYNSIR
ncbi:hypothetical protein, conserved [Angomonas deanei]|uniref:Uncharacterized protein n=1 Tax=Angomonas deanei TaxID=59799 RepID=A0A7G2CFP3_9TRYP|nr:hypothetical protein, conserved [Angomonas deanei]